MSPAIASPSFWLVVFKFKDAWSQPCLWWPLWCPCSSFHIWFDSRICSLTNPASDDLQGGNALQNQKSTPSLQPTGGAAANINCQSMSFRTGQMLQKCSSVYDNSVYTHAAYVQQKHACRIVKDALKDDCLFAWRTTMQREVPGIATLTCLGLQAFGSCYDVPAACDTAVMRSRSA